MNLTYNGKDNIKADKREVVSSYYADSIPTSDIVSSESTLYDIINSDPMLLQYFTAIDELDATINECNDMVLNNTLDMSIPITDPLVGRSSVVLGGSNDSIDQNTWLKAHSIYNSYDSTSLDKIQSIDLFEMLWTEIKIKVVDWMVDKFGGVPILGDKLKDEAASLRGKSLASDIGKMDNNQPINMQGLSYGITGQSIGSNLAPVGRDIVHATHAGNIINYVRKYISDHNNKVNVDANAVELKPVLDAHNKTWESTKRVILGTYGVDVWGLDTKVDITRTTPGNRTNMREWVGNEGKDIVLPAIDGYRYTREKILTDKFWDTAIVGTRKVYKDSLLLLKQYAYGTDLACCMLDNILSTAKLAGGIKYLKALKLAFIYAYNGLNIKIDSIFNSITDILNKIIVALMGELMQAIQGALDKWLLDLRKNLDGFYKSKGDTWRRCYPFDEFINYAIRILYQIEDDLMGYLNDWIGMMQLSQVKMTEYNINLKNRDDLKKYIDLLDALIRGIEMGKICKDLRDMHPTPVDEKLGFATQWGAIKNIITVDDAVNMGRTPDTGYPIEITRTTDEDILNEVLTPQERLWLQDCNKSMNESDIQEFKDYIKNSQ